MAKHVETFRLELHAGEAQAACRRALETSGRREVPCDGFAVRLPISTGGAGLGEALVLPLLRMIPFARRLLDEGLTVRLRSPGAPIRSDYEICAVLGSLGTEFGYLGIALRTVRVRISLRDAGAFGTDLTLRGSGTIPRTVRSAVGGLRRSIEIQAGSLHPYST